MAIYEDIIYVEKFVDEYANAGYITAIKGKVGQTLKIFDNYCIVTTKNESKKTELENMFYQFEDDDTDDEKELLSYDDKKHLVKGVMSGKILQAGIGVAMSATINKQENEKNAEKRRHERHKKIARLISVGDRRINLRNISELEMFNETDTTNGYLRFIKKNIKDNTLYNSEYFFFNNSMPFESKK